MAVYKTYYIDLDMYETMSNKKFTVIEGDTANIIRITLTDRGDPVDLSNCLLRVIFAVSTQPVEQDNEGHGVTVEGDDHNIIVLHLYSTSFINGENSAQVQIYSGDTHELIATTPSFNFNGERAIANEDTLLATEAWPLLTKMLQELDDIARGVQADYAETDDTDAAYIKNKPVIGEDIQPATQTLTDASTIEDTAAFAVHTGSANLKVAWSAIKTMLNTLFSSLFAAKSHASQHASGGSDAITPSAIGAASTADLTSGLAGKADLSNGKVAADQTSSTWAYYIADKTLAATDAGRTLGFYDASATITVTVPAESTVSIPIGTEIEIVQWGAGTITIAAASGVNIYSLDGNLSLAGRYAVASLKKLAVDTWLLMGALQ